MALAQHPRVFFTRQQIPAIRQRVADHYRKEFDSFLALLANPSSLESKQKEVEAHWGSMNYAFVAALEPDKLRSLGFKLPGSIDTEAKLCGRAMDYVRQMLSKIASAPIAEHNYLDTGYPEPLTVPIAAAYDWCYDSLSSADRQSIVDAFVAGFNKRYAGRNPNTLEVKGLDMLANNQASAGMQDLLSILAFYGDMHAPSDVQTTMYRFFETLWMGRLGAELDVLYKDGANWHEGPGGYFTEGFVNLTWGIAALASALDVALPAQLPFYVRQGEHLQGFIKPMSIGNTCGAEGNKRCPPRYERWGSMSGGIAGPSCRHLTLAAGLLRSYGVASASLVKWGIDKTTASGCSSLGVSFAGPWANAVFYWFLFGDRGIEAKGPSDVNLPLSLKHGLDAYTFKTGYGEPTDTHVVFFAQENESYGHGTQNYGDFTLSKHGNLIVTAANRKSGDGQLDTVPTSGSLFRNVLTLHKGDSDVTLGYNASGAVPDPLKPYGLKGLEKAGTVLADALGFGGVDYVSYDNSVKFSSKTATLSQREFVYIRGPENSEYLVLLDRLNAMSPSTDEKVWRIWTPNKPEFADGSGSLVREGKWTSSNSTLVNMTNRFGPLSASTFSSGATNGRFFLKTLLPHNPVISFLGGANMEFQNGNDDGTTTWGAPTLTQAMREYLGWGRIEVRPAVAQNYDVFLNVIQFGRADEMNTPTPTIRVPAQGSMTGAHIRDSQNEWITLFATEGWPGSPRTSTSYSYKPVSATTQHLLVNMQPSTRFYIRAASSGSDMVMTISTTPGGQTSSADSTEGGVLRFAVGSSGVAVLQKPSAPKNFRADIAAP